MISEAALLLVQGSSYITSAAKGGQGSESYLQFFLTKVHFILQKKMTKLQFLCLQQRRWMLNSEGMLAIFLELDLWKAYYSILFWCVHTLQTVQTLVWMVWKLCNRLSRNSVDCLETFQTIQKHYRLYASYLDYWETFPIGWKKLQTVRKVSRDYLDKKILNSFSLFQELSRLSANIYRLPGKFPERKKMNSDSLNS